MFNPRWRARSPCNNVLCYNWSNTIIRVHDESELENVKISRFVPRKRHQIGARGLFFIDFFFLIFKTKRFKREKIVSISRNNPIYCQCLKFCSSPARRARRRPANTATINYNCSRLYFSTMRRASATSLRETLLIDEILKWLVYLFYVFFFFLLVGEHVQSTTDVHADDDAEPSSAVASDRPSQPLLTCRAYSLPMPSVAPVTTEKSDKNS